MKRKQKNPLVKKLDRVTFLLEYLLVLELARTSLNWSEIGKHARVEKAKLNAMLKGTKIKRDRKDNK